MQSKTNRMMAALTAMCVLAATTAVRAADVEVNVDVVSAYVWRGITFNDGLVLQPEISTEAGLGEAGSLGIEVWANMDLDDFNDTLEEGEFSEVNFVLAWNLPTEGFDLSVGLIQYLFPGVGSGDDILGGGNPTREVFVEAGFGLADGVTLTLFGAYDFDEVEDYYLSATLAYEVEVAAGTTLEISGLAGYAGKDMAAGGERGFHEWEVRAAIEHELTDAISVGAFIAYTDAIDSDSLPDGPQDVNVYGGASLTWTF